MTAANSPQDRISSVAEILDRYDAGLISVDAADGLIAEVFGVSAKSREFEAVLRDFPEVRAKIDAAIAAVTDIAGMIPENPKLMGRLVKLGAKRALS